MLRHGSKALFFVALCGMNLDASGDTLRNPSFRQPNECSASVCTIEHNYVKEVSATLLVPASVPLLGFNGGLVGPTLRLGPDHHMLVSVPGEASDTVLSGHSHAVLEKSGEDEYVLEWAGAGVGGTFFYHEEGDGAESVAGGAVIVEDAEGSLNPFLAHLEERVLVLQHFQMMANDSGATADVQNIKAPPSFAPSPTPTPAAPALAPTVVAAPADNGRMVILRTFCPFDIDELANGFDAWATMFPCENHDANSTAGGNLVDVDILLFFSAAWELWPKAKETADGIIAKFDAASYPWARCFGKMAVDSAMLAPEEDLYSPPMQQTNRLWVNGPNRQFEKGLRASQSKGYQLAYLMEPDSVPLSPKFLDELRTEVEERRPFAVLGSKYRGDKWYDFLNQLEVPLLNHINGNAIYNVSHIIMQLMLKQLEGEADQMYNFIPFDLRMGQMWAEGALGVVENMLPSGQLLNLVPNVTTPKNNTELFGKWWSSAGFTGGPNGTSPVMQESVAIKNYAATNMLPKFLGPEIIIHGAAMFSRWEADRPLALVVSDWDEGFLGEFIESLDHDGHPFHEVVVMRPKGAGRLPYQHLATAAMRGIAIRTVERAGPDFKDWCEAPVDSEWFMYINTYHKVRRNVDLLLTDDGKPLVSYIYGELPFCADYPACAHAMKRTQDLFDPDADKMVQDFEMVFNSGERDTFCAAWNEQNPPTPDEPCVPQGPTATAYLGYLSTNAKAKKLYKLKDKAQYGWRSAFKHVHESKTLSACIAAGIADVNGTLLETQCHDMEDAESCAAKEGCAFDCQFATCYKVAPESGFGLLATGVGSLQDQGDGDDDWSAVNATMAVQATARTAAEVTASKPFNTTKAEYNADVVQGGAATPSSKQQQQHEQQLKLSSSSDRLAADAALGLTPPPAPTPPPSPPPPSLAGRHLEGSESPVNGGTATGTATGTAMGIATAGLGTAGTSEGKAGDGAAVEDELGSEATWWTGNDVVLVNALQHPVMALTAGKWYRWRLVFASAVEAMTGLTLAFSNASACQARVLAVDGQYLALPRPARALALDEGGTLDASVRCDEGRFRLIAAGASLDGTLVGHKQRQQQNQNQNQGFGGEASILSLNVEPPEAQHINDSNRGKSWQHKYQQPPRQPPRQPRQRPAPSTAPIASSVAMPTVLSASTTTPRKAPATPASAPKLRRAGHRQRS